MYCGECGNKLTETDKVCPKCGTKTTNNDIKNNIFRNKNISSRIHNLNKKTLIIVLIALLIIFIVIFVYKKSNHRKDNTNDYNFNSNSSKTNISDYTESDNKILLSNISDYLPINYSADTNTSYDVKYGMTDNRLIITKIKVRDKRRIDPNIDYLYIYKIDRERVLSDSIKTYTSESEYGYTSIDTLLSEIKWVGNIYNYQSTPNTYKITYTYVTEDNTSNNENVISETEGSIIVNNQDYYEPIQVNNSEEINGIYKEQNLNTKYVIQDNQIEYWEEQYIYLGTIYMKKGNELHIEFKSRYKYDETKDKYIIEMAGSTSLFKVNKDGELLTVISENELIDSNGAKYTKENKYQISKTYIGISGIDITEEMSKMYNIPRGIYVKDVALNSPAEKAGICYNDVITDFNGSSIYSMSELNSLKDEYLIGATVWMNVYRDNDYFTVYVKLEENPNI